MTKDQTPIQCNPHPDAPHGFSRDGSHSLGRYVCDCEGWAPDENMTKDQAIALPFVSWSKEAEMRASWVANKPAPDCRNVTPAEDVLLRNATLRAGKKIEKPDCRTCVNRYNGDITWVCGRDCTNGDQYQPAPAVVLWRTE